MESIVAYLEHSLKNRGFKRKGSLLQRELPQVVQLAKITKPRYGGSIPLEIGVILKCAAVPADLKSPILSWHINSRAADVSSDFHHSLQVLNPDYPLGIPDREREIEKLLDEVNQRFYGRLSTAEEVAAFAQSGGTPKVRVIYSFRQFVLSENRPQKDVES